MLQGLCPSSARSGPNERSVTSDGIGASVSSRRFSAGAGIDPPQLLALICGVRLGFVALVVLLFGVAGPASAEEGRLAGIDQLLSQIEAHTFWSSDPLAPAYAQDESQVRLVQLMGAASQSELDSVSGENIDRIANLLIWPHARNTAAAVLASLGPRATRALMKLRAAVAADCRRMDAIATSEGAYVNVGIPDFANIGNAAVTAITGERGSSKVCDRYNH